MININIIIYFILIASGCLTLNCRCNTPPKTESPKINKEKKKLKQAKQHSSYATKTSTISTHGNPAKSTSNPSTGPNKPNNHKRNKSYHFNRKAGADLLQACYNGTSDQIDFSRLHSNQSNQVAQEKIKCLESYFNATTMHSQATNITITVKEKQNQEIPRWDKSNKTIGELAFFDGFIEETSSTNLHVIFGNKEFGGGVLGNGSVQEEIYVITHPETLLVKAIKPSISTMTDNQAILIEGVYQYATYTGYANSFKFGQAVNKGPYNVVTMDAVDFNKVSGGSQGQFRGKNILRELKKAYIAFSPGPTENNLAPVATGEWGCGVFAGDKELKAIIQLIAAAENKRKLVYCSKDQTFNHRFQEIHAHLLSKHVKIQDLYSSLAEFKKEKDNNSNASLFDFLKKNI